MGFQETMWWDIFILFLAGILSSPLNQGYKSFMKKRKRSKIARLFYKYVNEDDIEKLYDLIRYRENSQEILEEMLKISVSPSNAHTIRFFLLLRPETFEFSLFDEKKRSYISSPKANSSAYYFHEEHRKPNHDPKVKEEFLKFVR